MHLILSNPIACFFLITKLLFVIQWDIFSIYNNAKCFVLNTYKYMWKIRVKRNGQNLTIPLVSLVVTLDIPCYIIFAKKTSYWFNILTFAYTTKNKIHTKKVPKVHPFFTFLMDTIFYHCNKPFFYILYVPIIHIVQSTSSIPVLIFYFFLFFF